MFRKSKGPTMSQRRGHEEHEYEHINDLPDCVLHHILSFMPTKEAVKTSILSTRWKNLWAFVPSVDIDDELLYVREVGGRRRPDVTSFVKFVERVLRLRDASNMEKFRLSCRVFSDASQIQSWISDASMHNVEELDLSLFVDDLSVIPWSMFDSTSLVSLKIRMDNAIKLPSHVSFPSLKSLHLPFVRFQNDDFIENLFSGCPVVEELVLCGNCWRNLKNIAISSSSLKRLTTHDPSRFDDPSGCVITIDAANLTYLEYVGYLSNKIILNDSTSSLDKAFIHIPNPCERLSKLTCRTIDLLKQLQDVVSLRLPNRTMESVLFADNMVVRFPYFDNLTHLMLSMEIGMSRSFKVVMNLLSSYPAVPSLRFSEGSMRLMHLAGKTKPICCSIPICISNCLKTVTLNNFHAYASEIRFLKSVFKYACVLERIHVSWSETYLGDMHMKTEVSEQLENTERSSTACVISFS